MKLLKKDAEKITQIYNLGELKEFKLNPGGAVNYNFDFKTSKGDFMVKFISGKMTAKIKARLNFGFEFTNFLYRNNFPYKIPNPLMNIRGKFLSKLNGNYFWVYKKIEGEVNYNFDNIKEIARALATFHKFSAKYKTSSELKYSYVEDLLVKYSKMKKRIRGLNEIKKVDKMAISNFNLFFTALNKIKELPRKNLIITHSDFGNHNLLFNKNKVEAILDFETLGLNPRIKEIAYPIKRVCFKEDKLDKNKVNLFLKEYEKTIKLTNEEKKLIIPMMILDSCNVFYWVYMEMQKNKSKRAHFLDKTINKMKYLIREYEMKLK